MKPSLLVQCQLSSWSVSHLLQSPPPQAEASRKVCSRHLLPRLAVTIFSARKSPIVATAFLIAACLPLGATSTGQLTTSRSSLGATGAIDSHGVTPPASPTSHPKQRMSWALAGGSFWSVAFHIICRWTRRACSLRLQCVGGSFFKGEFSSSSHTDWTLQLWGTWPTSGLKAREKMSRQWP